MEVTRTNFAKVLPEIKESINNALFLAIDGEFTGLRTGPDVTNIDTPSEYYSKLRSGSFDFLLIQFGLAIFNYDVVKKKYTYKAYSFYLFPRPSNLARGVQDTWFKAQASSLDLLASSNFDFNKVFHKGIPFLNQVQQDIVLNSLEERRRLRTLDTKPEYENHVPIPDEHKQAVQSACDAVEKFLSNKTLQTITLPKCNGFVRKLIYQTLKSKFGCQDFHLETENMNIIVKKYSSMKERLKEEKDKIRREEAELKENIGFSLVIEAISKSRRPIVGHNMMLDLCHIIKRFWKPLPEEYENFKALLHHVFPVIIDTKYLCTLPELKSTLISSCLKDIYDRIHLEPFDIINVEMEAGKGYNLSEWKQHDAGFDAFITGVVYQTLINHIGFNRFNFSEVVLPHHPVIKNDTNRVYLMKVDSYMNLDGPEPIVDRSHVFHLTFPKEWKVSDITRLFNSYGGVYIRWINDISALVTLQNKDKTSIVTEVLVDRRKAKNFCNSVYKLIPYAEYVATGGTRRPQIFNEFLNLKTQYVNDQSVVIIVFLVLGFILGKFYTLLFPS